MDSKKSTQNQGKRSDQSQKNIQAKTSDNKNSVTEIMEVVDSLP